MEELEQEQPLTLPGSQHGLYTGLQESHLGLKLCLQEHALNSQAVAESINTFCEVTDKDYHCHLILGLFISNQNFKLFSCPFISNYHKFYSNA